MYIPSKIIKIEVKENNELIKTNPDEKVKFLYRYKLKEEEICLYDVFFSLLTFIVSCCVYQHRKKKRTKIYKKKN